MAENELVADKVDVSCPLCGNNTYALKYVERGFNIVSCSKCGLYYVNPRLSHQKIKEIYDDYYFRPDHWRDYLKDTYQDAEIKKQNISPRRAEKLWFKRYAKIIRFIKSRSSFSGNAVRVLDVGAGSGRWLTAVKENDWEGYGFDISDSDYIQNKAADDPFFRVAPDIEQAGYKNEYFDIITLWDVIEHLEDPVRTLVFLRGLLKPGGWLFIETPNSTWQMVKVKLKMFIPARILSEYGIFLPEQHLQTFNLKTLKKALAVAGFSRMHSIILNWEEPKGWIGKMIYQGIYYQAVLCHLITAGRRCSNIGLSVFSRK